MAERIDFYSTKDPYGEFSNFATFPLEIDGKTWPTSEHYFQAQKFAGTPHEEELRAIESPMKVALAGRERHRPLRPDWEEVKDDVMRRALRAKFTQHDSHRELLLGTGESDSYWGDGGDRTGGNMLGKLLMELRTELRGEDDTS